MILKSDLQKSPKSKKRHSPFQILGFFVYTYIIYVFDQKSNLQSPTL